MTDKVTNQNLYYVESIKRQSSLDNASRPYLRLLHKAHFSCGLLLIEKNRMLYTTLGNCASIGIATCYFNSILAIS